MSRVGHVLKEPQNKTMEKREKEALDNLKELTPVKEATEPKVDTTIDIVTTKEEAQGVGSKVIVLRRQEGNNHLPKEVWAESEVKLSSVFKNRQPLKGFPDPKDEERYLTELLVHRPGDREWSEEVKRFWAELRIKVPYGGVKLEIGKDASGNPLKIMEWVYYNFAKQHPQVADTKEEMEKYHHFQFYIQDPEKETENKTLSVKRAKMASIEFIKLADDKDLSRDILRVLNSKIRVDSLNDDEIENTLFDEQRSNPDKFLKIAKDKNIKIRASISRFLEYGVLQKVGNSIINGDETIGNDMAEAIIYLKNPKNSGVLNILEVRLKEKTR
jgi:hypothetical protein